MNFSHIIRTAALTALTAGALILLFNVRDARERNNESAENERNERLEATYAMEAMKWQNAQRAYPTGTIPVDWRSKAELEVAKMNLRKTASTAQLQWAELG